MLSNQVVADGLSINVFLLAKSPLKNLLNVDQPDISVSLCQTGMS